MVEEDFLVQAHFADGKGSRCHDKGDSEWDRNVVRFVKRVAPFVAT